MWRLSSLLRSRDLAWLNNLMSSISLSVQFSNGHKREVESHAAAGTQDHLEHGRRPAILRQDSFYEIPVHIREPIIAPLESVREALVIEP